MSKFKTTYHHQLAFFPMEINQMIPSNHLVRVVNSFVDELSYQLLTRPFSKEGAQAYEPRTMLKVILYSYAIKLYSSRKIERAMLQDITFFWLSGRQSPDHNTINRFRSDYFREILDEVFTDMIDYLHNKGYIKFETYFTDGTKIEADANKYSHVWKKNIERYKKQLQERVKVLFAQIDELNKTEDQQYNKGALPELGNAQVLNSQEIKQVAAKLNQTLEKRANKKQQRNLQSKINKLNKESEQLTGYEQQETILGGRNSYSKTDHDSTFMRMKNDELKPTYNVEISTENQFVVNHTVNQNASDSATFVEHVEKVEKRGEEYLPKNWSTDAGYGSQENYAKIEDHKIESYLKYSSFYQDTKGGNKNPFHKDHFQYQSQCNCYVCPAGKELSFVKEELTTTSTGYQITLKHYQASECTNCPYKEKCTKAENRSIQRNEKLEQYKATAYANLTSEKGIQLRKQRNIDVEPVFGDIKHNCGYRRLRLRGLPKVTHEVGLLCLAHNLRKIQIKQQNSLGRCA